MSKELAGNFVFTISAFRMTKHGGCRMVLDISEQQAAKALALALVPEANYEADVFIFKP